MKKLLKSRKALSPVVAAIILIAVTVAVSIAVAAWMGALTIGFMGTKELKITAVYFDGTSDTATNDIIITVKNPGTGKVTVGDIKVNDVSNDFTGTGTYQDFDAGASHNLTITDVQWVSGNKYKITMLSSDGTPVGAYEATA